MHGLEGGAWCFEQRSTLWGQAGRRLDKEKRTEKRLKEGREREVKRRRDDHGDTSAFTKKEAVSVQCSPREILLRRKVSKKLSIKGGGVVG